MKTNCSVFRSYYFQVEASHSSPAGGAKTHTLVFQTLLNLRGRRLVSPCSLLFYPDDGLIQTVRNVVSVNSKIQILNQIKTIPVIF